MEMNKGVVCVCAALALQVVAVGFLVWRYERIVQKGTEVRIKCQAYDPYDPLRGRYLRVTVSETCTNILFEVDADNYWKVPEGDIYAKLAKAPGDGGLYLVEAVAREPADAGLWVKTKSLRLARVLGHEDKRKGESYDEFYARQRESGTKAVVSFPDQLFVNEKVAPEAEELLRKAIASAVAVFRVLDGEIVLTDIEIGGKPILSAVREKRR